MATKKRNKNKKDDLNEKNNKLSSVDKELSGLDKTAKNILSILDSSYTDKQILSNKDQKVPFRNVASEMLPRIWS